MRNNVEYNERLHRQLIKELDFDDSVVIDRLKSAVLKSVLIYYSTHTARETCKEFGIPFTQEYVKILHKLHPKNMGLGGDRRSKSFLNKK